MPEMPHVEIPSAVHLLDRHLERAFAVLKAAISDGLHMVGCPPGWGGTGGAAGGKPRHGKHNGGYGSALERFHRAHLIPPRAAIYRTINDQLTIAGAAARGAAQARLDRRVSATLYRTFTQTLFSSVNSRMTEKPISRPYPLCL